MNAILTRRDLNTGGGSERSFTDQMLNGDLVIAETDKIKEIRTENLFINCRNIEYVNFPECSVYSPAMYASVLSTTISGIKIYYQRYTSNSSQWQNVPFPVTNPISIISLPAVKKFNCYYNYSSNKYFNLFANLVSVHTIYLRDIEEFYCGYYRSFFLPFAGLTNLKSLYIMNSSFVPITILSQRQTGMFESTPIVRSSYLGYYGSIYVPMSLLETYRADTEWYNQIEYNSERFVGV